jgi:hypothetical protein
VEEQARPVEQLAKLLQEAGAELVISLTASEWREVLRAAQAEAERRRVECQTCGKTGGAVLSYQDGPGTTSRWCCPNCAGAAERRAQEAEHGIARWEVYAQGLEAQVRSAREAALREASDAIEMLERNMNYGPSVADALAVLRALSSSPVSSQREPKA